MNKIGLLFLLITFTSCSPKLRSSITKEYPELKKGELVVVLDIFDEQVISGEKVGEIKATDNMLSNNCSYYENIINLKALARKSGANLIKLTKHKRADQWSSCDRLWATIYKVNDVKKYETEIEWSSDRKLTWDDFKGKPDTTTFPNAVALTSSSLGFESSSVNLFNDSALFIRSVFINHGSWVLDNAKTDYILRHEQIHFDITEIYSRMLRKAFKDANITMNDGSKAIAIFEKIKNKWQERQEYYDYQTENGSKKETQENWEAIIEIELAKYDFYKLN